MRHHREIEMLVKSLRGHFLARGPDGMAVQIGALRIIASSGDGWDHVSVSREDRIPNYNEMCAAKRVFFEDTEWAVEYHAPVEKHINIHPRVLHIWRPQTAHLPVPPDYMV